MAQRYNNNSEITNKNDKNNDADNKHEGKRARATHR